MNKKRLYEQIMTSVSKEVKRALNEQAYSLSIDDNDFEDDLDIRHKDDKGFNSEKVRYSIIMRDYIEKHDKFKNLTKGDYIYIESLYDKYGAQYKVKDREELDQIIMHYRQMNKHLNWLDVSNVTDMSQLFGRMNTHFMYFNLDISKWDVSNVTNMQNMFWFAEYFNQPIDKWDVSNVTDMSGMFCGAKRFNQPIGDWDVSNVTNMCTMFYDAHHFNQPIGDWDVSNVTNIDAMFSEAAMFNQSIANWHISSSILTKDVIWGLWRGCPISEENKPLVLR